MSPAEKLSSKKKKRKPPSIRKVVFKCDIAERRHKLNLTIRDVADAVGLTVAAVSVIERGASPMLESAQKLAAFFGADINEIWSKA